jgi:hypothetical protein
MQEIIARRASTGNPEQSRGVPLRNDANASQSEQSRCVPPRNTADNLSSAARAGAMPKPALRARACHRQ